MMKKFYILLIITFCLFKAQSQPLYDTLSIIHYNILRYGAPGISCQPLEISLKNPYLKTFIDYYLPDIFSVNEIGDNQSYVDALLIGALNTNGRSYYKAADYHPNGDNIGDIIFYNSSKIQLINQSIIECSPRDFFLYNFKYVNPSKKDDIAYFTCVIGHLKASNSTPEANERAGCAANIMNHLTINYNKTGNYFVMGDFNLYKTSEPAYINFTTNSNPRINFFDPVYALSSTNGHNFYIGNNTVIGTGTWNKQELAPYHTQCAAATQLNCGSGGGMDDRFDYILANRSVLDDSAKINFIPGTYQAIGNDGLHYNKSINDGPNASAPSNVITALYNISDHLPVALKVRIEVTVPPLIPVDSTIIISGNIIKTPTNVLITSSTATISGTYLESSVTGITITGIKNETTLPGTYFTVSGLYTINAGIINLMVVSSVTPPHQLVTGSVFKSATNINIIGLSTTISGTYKTGPYNQITITGVRSGEGGISYNSTIIGFYNIEGSAVMLNIASEFSTVVTAVQEEYEENTVTASPNPFGEWLRIDVKGQKSKLFHVSLYSIYGNEVLSQQLMDGDLNVNVKDVRTGLYILTVTKPDGKKTILKVIKK